LNGFARPADRAKPWGTAHAVLCGAQVIEEPFAVINADDFYGRDAFVKAYEFLVTDCNEKKYAIIGYRLRQTLSDHGTVNRGICKVDERGHLVGVTERLNISVRDGLVTCDDGLQPVNIDIDTIVSMNFWCFDKTVFDYTSKLFEEFLKERGQEEKSEFFIPIVADSFINKGEGNVDVIPTSAQWFGVTYKADAPAVKEGIDRMLAAGEYPTGLWK